MVCHIAAEAVKLEIFIPMAILNTLDGIFTRTVSGLSKSSVGHGTARLGQWSLRVQVLTLSKFGRPWCPWYKANES